MDQYDFQDDSYDEEDERVDGNLESEDTADASETDHINHVEDMVKIEQRDGRRKYKEHREEKGKEQEDKVKYKAHIKEERVEDVEPRKHIELKDQVYGEKLRSFKYQIAQVNEGTLPEFMRKVHKLDMIYQERMKFNEDIYHLELEMAEQQYIREKKAAAREFEEKKIELRENLIAELEDKKILIKNEHLCLELNAAFPMEVKPTSTRKLRRRPNDPIPMPEKRRKTAPNQFSFLLDDHEILDDLRYITKSLESPSLARTEPSWQANNYDSSSEEDRRRVRRPRDKRRINSRNVYL